jgi:hypothetical protein
MNENSEVINTYFLKMDDEPRPKYLLRGNDFDILLTGGLYK